MDARTRALEATSKVDSLIVHAGDADFQLPKKRPSWTVGVCIASTCVFLILAQGRSLFGFSRHQTTGDQTLLWAAGEDLIHRRFWEPNFYGQTFLTTFEALPGALLHSFGINLGTAFPFGTTLLVTLCWLLLAGIAYRKQLYIATLVALAIPVVLNGHYLLMFNLREGSLSGDLLAVLAIAAAMLTRDLHWRIGLVAALGGLSALWDNSALLAVLPVVAASIGGRYREIWARPVRSITAAAAGAMIPLSWWGFSDWFYSSHPKYLTATPIPRGLHFAVLAHNLHHLSTLVGFYAPELWTSPDLAVALLCLVVLAATLASVLWRRPEPVLAALTLFATVLVALSVQESLDVHAGLYLSGNRFLTPLPFGIWVIVFYLAESYRQRSINLSRKVTTTIIAPIAVLAAVSSVSFQASFTSTVITLQRVDRTAAAVTPTIDPSTLLHFCDEVAHLYHVTHADTYVTNDAASAYACAANDGLNTLDLTYERRGWLLEAAAIRPVTRILIGAVTCQAIPAGAGRCFAEPFGISLVISPPRPAAKTLDLAGIHIRGLPPPSA